MNYFNGTLAYTSAGIKSPVNIGFQPVLVRASVSQKAGVTQLFSHSSFGSGSPTFQHVDATFQDGTGGKTLGIDGKVVSHYERVSGNITEVLAMKINSFTATGVSFEVLVPNLNYNVYIEVFG